MPQSNKKALTGIRAECVRAYLSVLLESRTIWIQVVFPSNASLSVTKHVFVFNSVHFVHNVMGNHGLQFTNKAIKDLHFDNGHESGLLQSPAVTGNCSEMVIDAGQAVIRPEFSSKMFPSQVCLLTGEFGQGRIRAKTRVRPAHLIAGTQAAKSVKSKLGHYRKCNFEPGRQAIKDVTG